VSTLGATVGAVNVAWVVDGGVDRAAGGAADPPTVVDAERLLLPHAAPSKVTSRVAATAYRRMTTTVGRCLVDR
jgi:hypothetical protein